jgi:hypothetical protein
MKFVITEDSVSKREGEVLGQVWDTVRRKIALQRKLPKSGK